jgi:YtoQ family protein
MEERAWTVYLAGEIHTDWRKELLNATLEADLPVDYNSPVLDHGASDDCGVAILGEESSDFWKDHKAAKINALRIRTLIQEADVVVVRFGDKYRQWNAAFDAGFAVANDKPLITLHDPALDHALKEVDASALAVCETTEQVVDILRYVIDGVLPQ